MLKLLPICVITKTIFLQTVSVYACGANNNNKLGKVQLVFDSGSQRSYVSDRKRNLLILPTVETERKAVNTLGNLVPEIKMINVVLLKCILKNKVIQI